MYKVLCDGYILHDPTSDEARVFDAVLDLEVNTPNFFNFTIYPNNPSFGFIQRLKSVIEVYDDGELIFRGRPLNDTYNLYKAQTIQCEGDRAFFNDSILRPYNFSGSIENYLTMMIDSHNSQVEVDKQFALGDVTVTDPNDYIVRSTSQHVKTWDEMKSKLIDNLGGYIRVRRVNEINFIDYLHDSFTISGQSIELTKNILDYQQEIDVSEIATVLIPLGAKLEDEEGNETDERLTIGSVNGGLDYIEHSTGISKYGKIWAVQIWDDVTLPENLKSRGQSSLNTLVNLGVSIEIRAIDLNLVDKSESKLRFFDYVRIISKPHEVDEEMLIKKQTININDPSQNVIEVGVQFATFTDKQLRNDNVIRLIEANYVTNKTVGEIKQLTTILQSSITQNAENIAIEVSERQETDRVLSEKISEIDVDISSIRLEVSQIGGYNIISNPIGRFGLLDWTFESEHIKAYANTPFNKAYANAPYLKAQADNGSIMVGVPTDTQAKYGFRVWKAGKALSQYAVVESGSDYSLHTKVKGDAVLRFKLREYTSATPTSKSSFFKETLLSTTNPTTNYSTYEKTVTLDNTTQSVVLVVESDVSSRNGQFALFTNTSFNIGQPKPYGESITDVNNRVDDINARVTLAEDKVDIFTSRVNTVEGRVDSNTAQLQVQAGEISSKVSTNGVISAINQTAESIKINASRIDLTGYVTVSSLAGQGTTTIDGSNIKTGTISANRINFNGATGTNVNLSGTITATSGKIAGFDISGNDLVGQNVSLSPREIAIGGSAIKNYVSGSTNNIIIDAYRTRFRDNGVITIGDYTLGFVDEILGQGVVLGATSDRILYIYLKNQPNVASDIRQKHSIQDIPKELLEEISKVEPKMYLQHKTWHFGYIAQDIERALYKWATSKYGKEARYYVDKFAMLHKDESYLSLLYGELSVLKEQQLHDRIDKLEQQLQTLLPTKGENNGITSKFSSQHSN